MSTIDRTPQSSYSLYNNSKEAKEKEAQLKADNKELKDRLKVVDEKVTEEQKNNLIRSKELLSGLEQTGSRTIGTIRASSSNLNKGINSATEMLQDNVKVSSALVRKAIASRLFEINKFRLLLFAENIDLPRFDGSTWEGSKALSYVFSGGPHAKYWNVVIPLGIAPDLDLEIEGDGGNGIEEKPKVRLFSKINTKKIEIGEFKVTTKQNRIVLDCIVSPYHLRMLDLPQKLNMDTFILTKEDPVYFVQVADKSDLNSVMGFVDKHFPKSFGVYIEPDGKADSIPSAGRYYNLGWKNFSEKGDVAILNYKRSKSIENWDQQQFLSAK